MMKHMFCRLMPRWRFRSLLPFSPLSWCALKEVQRLPLRSTGVKLFTIHIYHRQVDVTMLTMSHWWVSHPNSRKLHFIVFYLNVKIPNRGKLKHRSPGKLGIKPVFVLCRIFHCQPDAQLADSNFKLFLDM